MMGQMGQMSWSVLLVLALLTPAYGILPEIPDSGLNQLLKDDYARRRTPLDNMMEKQDGPQERSHTEGTQGHLDTTNSHSSGNFINHCSADQDCQKDHFCLQESKCLPCKALDVPCRQDAECCDGRLCVWGQCSQNATKGEAGSVCLNQEDCHAELCCAVHKALLFPVCSAKPIERERCYAPSNHLMTLFSWGLERQGPVDHCPCAGDLHCKPLGRGSLCLQRLSSSEEDLTDSLYSEIDYIV